MMKRLKYVVSLRSSRLEGVQDERPYIGLENIEPSTGRLVGSPGAPEATTPPVTGESESVSNTFEPGDVLFGKLRPYLAKAWVAEFPGRCTTELLVMQPVEVESRFLRYVCLSRDFIDAVDASTFGSKMPRADWHFIGNMAVPVPPLPQQCAIADYLDRETAQLDTLLAAKERVLGLLAEKRRALITRAVTRGLDPRALLRDSGVPWLGEIPAHWETRHLRYSCKEIQTGGTPSPEFLDYEGNDSIDWFTPGDFGESLKLGCSSRRVAAGAVDADELQMFPPGAVLVVGIGATVGKVGLLQAPAAANQQINALVPREDIYSGYLGFQMSLLTEVLRVSANMATLPILNQQRMGDIPVLVPPREEQRTIVEHVAHEVSKLGSVRAATERTIELLKERRAALIAAAVTGQIDVA